LLRSEKSKISFLWGIAMGGFAVMERDLGPRLYTEEETAAKLGVKLSTLRKWRLDGVGPRHVRLHRKMLRYTDKNIADWTESLIEKGGVYK
jgi:predicted DNA-binding transcriptional regulator AlpA